MHEPHFGLSRRPFPPSPDPAAYYPATGHERAIEALLAGLADGEGVVALFGGPGTGKTLVALCLAERLGDGVEVCFIPNAPQGGRAGLLQTILHDLGLPHEGRPEQELRLALVDHLLAKYREGRRTILVLDEAHSLLPEVLEEVRMLGNL